MEGQTTLPKTRVPAGTRYTYKVLAIGHDASVQGGNQRIASINCIAPGPTVHFTVAVIPDPNWEILKLALSTNGLFVVVSQQQTPVLAFNDWGYWSTPDVVE